MNDKKKFTETTETTERSMYGQKFSLSGAFERNFYKDVKIVRTRGWACTMQAQA
jgi:hypothetical protein